MARSLTLAAVGDIGAFHAPDVAMFEHVKEALAGADIRFAQNERHYNDSQVPPVGGFTEQVPPAHAAMLTDGGFDALSFASNHCMDIGAEAMLETVERLTDLGIRVIGVGEDIREAREPAILERNGTKVAILAYASVIRPGYEATVHKAGCAPMRAHTLYNQVDYQPGNPPETLTFAHKGDLAAVVDDIRAAREQADVVVVSFHWGIHFIHAAIADYEREVARAAIDAGADVILGSHPHMLKAIDVYQGKPIFHSTGNFAFDLPAREVAEWAKAAPGLSEKFERRGWVLDDPEWSEYTYPEYTRKSMIVQCEFRDGELDQVKFLPVMINTRAQPELLTADDPRFDEVVDYVRQVTTEQGLDTVFEVEGDAVIVKLSHTSSAHDPTRERSLA